VCSLKRELTLSSCHIYLGNQYYYFPESLFALSHLQLMLHYVDLIFWSITLGDLRLHIVVCDA